jgi:predicted transcriptional regulator
MSTRVIVDLPDHVYRQVESIARSSQREVTAVVAEVVARSVQRFPVDANREAMEREAAAFRAMHPALWRDYPGQYVAITGEKLVDHDFDPVALLERVRRDYPGRTVLRRRVDAAPEKTLRFRSPKFSTAS